MSLDNYKIHTKVLEAFEATKIDSLDISLVRNKISRFKRIQSSKYNFMDQYVLAMKQLLTDSKAVDALIKNDLLRTANINETKYYRTKDSIFVKDGEFFDIVRMGSRHSGIDSDAKAIANFKFHDTHAAPTGKFYLSPLGLPTDQDCKIHTIKDKFGHFIDHEGDRCNIVFDEGKPTEQITIAKMKFDIHDKYIIRESYSFKDALLRKIAKCHIVCYSKDQVVVRNGSSYEVYDMDGNKMKLHQIKIGTFKLVAVHLWQSFKNAVKDFVHVVRNFFTLILEKITRKEKKDVINGTDIDAVKILAANHYILSSFLLLCITTFFFPIIKFLVKRLWNLCVVGTKKVSESVQRKCEEISLYGVKPKKILCTFCSAVTWVRKGKFLCDPNVDITKIISPGLFILTCLFVQVEPFRVDGTNAIATIPIKNGYCTTLENINGTMEICLESAKHFYSKTESYETGIYNIYYNKNRECKKNGEGTCSNGCQDPFEIIGNINYSRSYCDYKSQPVSKCFFQYSCDYYACGFQPVELYDVYVCDYIEDEYMLKINGAIYQYVAQENVELSYGDISIMLTQSISNIDRVIHVFNDTFTSPRISYAMSPSFGQIGQIQTISGRTIWNDEVISCSFDNVYVNEIDVFDGLSQNVDCDESTCFTNITSKETILFTITMPLNQAFIMNTSPIKGNITNVDCFNTMQNYVRCNVLLNGTSNNFILNITEPRHDNYICSSPCEINIDNVSDKFILCISSENEFCGVVDVTSLRYNSTINGSPIYQKAKKAIEVWKIVLITIASIIVICFIFIIIYLFITKLLLPILKFIVPIIIFSKKEKSINGTKIDKSDMKVYHGTTITQDTITNKQGNTVNKSARSNSKKLINNKGKSEKVTIYDTKYKGHDKVQMVNEKFWHVTEKDGLFIYSPKTDTHCLLACQLLRELHLKRRVYIQPEVEVFFDFTPGQICKDGENHVVFVTDKKITEWDYEIENVWIRLKENENKRFFALPYDGEIHYKAVNNDFNYKNVYMNDYKDYLHWCVRNSRIPVVEEIFVILKSLNLPIVTIMSPQKIMTVKEHLLLCMLSNEGYIDNVLIDYFTFKIDNLKICMFQWYIFVCADYNARLHLLTFLFAITGGQHTIPDIKMNEYPLSINSYISRPLCNVKSVIEKMIYYFNNICPNDVKTLKEFVLLIEHNEEWFIDVIYKNDLAFVRTGIKETIKFANYFLVNAIKNVQNKKYYGTEIVTPPFDFDIFADRHEVINIDPRLPFLRTFVNYQFEPVYMSGKHICYFKKEKTFKLSYEEKQRRDELYDLLHATDLYEKTTIYDNKYHGYTQVVKEIKHNDYYIYTSQLSTLCYLTSCLLMRYNNHKDFHFEKYKIESKLTPNKVCKWNDNHVCYCSKTKLEFDFIDAKWYDIEFTGTFANPVWLQNPSENFKISFNTESDAKDTNDFQNYKDYVEFCMKNYMKPVTNDMFLLLRFLNFPFFMRLSDAKNLNILEVVALNYCFNENDITYKRYDTIKNKLKHRKVTKLQNLLCSMLPVQERYKCWPAIINEHTKGEEYIVNIHVTDFPKGCEKFIESLTDITKLIKLVNTDINDAKFAKDEQFKSNFRKEYGVNYEELNKMVNCKSRNKDTYYDRNRKLGKIPQRIKSFVIDYDTCNLSSYPITSCAHNDPQLLEQALKVEKDLNIDSLIVDDKLQSFPIILNNHVYQTNDIKCFKVCGLLNWQFVHQSVKLSPFIKFVKFNAEKLPMLSPTVNNIIMTHNSVNIFLLQTLRTFFSKISREEVIRVLQIIATKNLQDIDDICTKYCLSRTLCFNVYQTLGFNITWSDPHKMYPIDVDIILTYYDILTVEYKGGGFFDEWYTKMIDVCNNLYEKLSCCKYIEEIIIVFMNNIHLIKPSKYMIAGFMAHCACLLEPKVYYKLFHDIASIIEWNSTEIEQGFVKSALMGDDKLKDDTVINQLFIKSGGEIMERNDQLVPKCHIPVDDTIFMEEMKHWLNKTAVNNHRICYSLLKPNINDFYDRCNSGMCLFSSVLLPEQWFQYEDQIREFEKEHKKDEMWTNQSIYAAYSYFQEVNYGAILYYQGNSYVLNPTAKLFVQLYHIEGHMKASNILVRDPQLSMIPHLSHVSIDKFDMICNYNAAVENFPKETLITNSYVPDVTQFAVSKADDTPIPLDNYALRPDNPNKLIKLNTGEIFETHLLPGDTENKCSHCLCYVCGHSVSFFPFYPSLNYLKDHSGYFNIFGQLFFGFLKNTDFTQNVLNVHTNSFMAETESCAINILTERGIDCIGIINPVNSDMFYPLDEVEENTAPADIVTTLDKFTTVLDLKGVTGPLSKKVANGIKLGKSTIQLQRVKLSPQYCQEINEIRVVSCREDNVRKIEDLIIKISGTHVVKLSELQTRIEDEGTKSFLLWNPEVQYDTGSWTLLDNKRKTFMPYDAALITTMKFMPYFSYFIKDNYTQNDPLIDFEIFLQTVSLQKEEMPRQPKQPEQPVYDDTSDNSESHSCESISSLTKSSESLSDNSSVNDDNKFKVQLANAKYKKLFDFITTITQEQLLDDYLRFLSDNNIKPIEVHSEKILRGLDMTSHMHVEDIDQQILEWIDIYKQDIETTQLMLKQTDISQLDLINGIYSGKISDILNYITITFEIFSIQHTGTLWFDTPFVTETMIKSILSEVFGYTSDINLVPEELYDIMNTTRYIIHLAQFKSFYLCPLMVTLVNSTSYIRPKSANVIKAHEELYDFVRNSKFTNMSMQSDMKKIDHIDNITINVKRKVSYKMLPKFRHEVTQKIKINTSSFIDDRRQRDDPPTDFEELLRAGSDTRGKTMEEIFQMDNKNKSNYITDFRFDITVDRLREMPDLLDSYCIERPTTNFTDIQERKLPDDVDYLELMNELLHDGYAVSKLFGLTFYSAKESRITKYAIIGPKTLLLCKCNCAYKYYTTYIKDINQQDIFYCKHATLNNTTLGDFEVSSRRFTNKFYHLNNKVYYIVDHGQMFITNHHDVPIDADFCCLLNGYEFSKTYIALTSLPDGVYGYDGLEFYQNELRTMRISTVGRIMGFNNQYRIIGVDDSHRNTNKPLCGKSHFPYYNTMTNDELTTLIQSTGKDLENNSGFSDGVYYNKNRIIFVGMLPQSNKRSAVKSYVCSKNSGGFCFFTAGESQHGTIKVINRFHQHKIDLEIAENNFGGLVIDVTDGTTLRYCEMFCNLWSLNTKEGKINAALDISNITDDGDAYVFGDCCYYNEIRQYYNNSKCYQISTYYEIIEQSTQEYQVKIEDDNVISVQLDGEGSPWKCSITDMVSILNNTKMIKKFTLNNITLFCGQYHPYCHVEHNVIFTAKQQNEIIIASNIKNASSKTTFFLTRTSLDPSTIAYGQSLYLKQAWNSAQFYDQIEVTSYAKAIEKFIPGLHRILVALQTKPGVEPDTMFEEIVHLILGFKVDKLLESIEDIVQGIVNIYTGKTESANRFFKRLSENSIVPDGNMYFDYQTRQWKIFTQSEVIEALHTYELENKVLTWKINGEYSFKDKIKILWYMICNDHSSIKILYEVVKTWVKFILGKCIVMSNIPINEDIRYTHFIEKSEEKDDTIVSAISEEISSIPIIGDTILKKTGLAKNVDKNCLVDIRNVDKTLLITVCSRANNEIVHYIILEQKGPYKLMNKYDEVIATKSKIANSKSKFVQCLKDWKYINVHERGEILKKYAVDVAELNHQFDELACLVSNKPFDVQGIRMYNEYYKGVLLTWPFGNGSKAFMINKNKVDENTTTFSRKSIEKAFFELSKNNVITKALNGVTNIVYEPTVCPYDCHTNDTATYIFQPTMSAATVPFTSASTVSEVCKYRFNTGFYKNEAVRKFAEFMKPILEDTITAGIEFAQKSEIKIEDYLNHLQGDKKHEAIAAYEHFSQSREVNTRYHLILKNDEMPITNPEKHARVIAAPERTHKLIIGYCAYIIEQFMIQHLKGFMIGKTGEEIRDTIMQDYRVGDNFVSLDTKAFDGSQHLPLQKTIDNELSKIAYLHVLKEFGPEGTHVLTDLSNIGEIWDSFTKIVCGFNVKAKYDLTGCVPSGHALHTTVANTYRAIYYQKYLLNDPDARVNAAGDDTLLVLDDYELQKWKDNMHLVYSPESLGQTLKELIISKDYFTFCSMKFTLHNTVMKDLTNYVGRYMTFSNENPICNFIQKTAAIMDWHESEDFRDIVKTFSNFDEQVSNILKERKDFLYLLEKDKLLATKELYYTPVSKGCQHVDVSDLYAFFPDIMQYMTCTTVKYDYEHHRPVTRFEFMTNNWYNQLLPNQILGDFIMPYDLDKLEEKICNVFQQLIQTDCEMLLRDYFEKRSFVQRKY